MRHTSPDRPPAVRRVHVARGQVTAAAAAPRSGRVCIGLSNGLAMTFDPVTGSTQPCTFGAKQPWPITSAAFDADGDQLLIVRTNDGKWAHLAAYHWRDGAFRYPAEVWWSTPVNGTGYVTPPVREDGVQMAGFWDGKTFALLSGPDLIPVGRVEMQFSPDLFRGVLLSSFPDALCCVFVEDEGCWLVKPDVDRRQERLGTLIGLGGWRPGAPEDSELHHVPFAWMQPTLRQWHMAGADEQGALHWSAVDPYLYKTPLFDLVFSAREKYRAAAFVGPDRIAGVRPGGVDWLRRGENRLTLSATTPADLRDAVACFFSPPTGELLVVTSGGDVVRAAAPNV